MVIGMGSVGFFSPFFLVQVKSARCRQRSRLRKMITKDLSVVPRIEKIYILTYFRVEFSNERNTDLRPGQGPV